MSLARTRHLGGTATVGTAASGTRYLSHTQRAPHTTCWMTLAVFERFPTAPSLAGTRVQRMAPGINSLMASTRGAGTPVGGSHNSTATVRLAFELFDDESPVACANFRALCVGGAAELCKSTASAAANSEAGTATTAPWRARGARYYYQDIGPSYRGTSFHKIIPGFCVQGGDITMRLLPSTTGSPTMRSANQFSGSPARRTAFADENKKRRHCEAGLLSMANTGPNTNGSQFFITTSGAHETALNGRHVCFGRVTEGLPELLREVAPYGDVQGKPSRYVVVVDCGVGPLPEEGEEERWQELEGGESTKGNARLAGGDDGNAAEEGNRTTPVAATKMTEDCVVSADEGTEIDLVATISATPINGKANIRKPPVAAAAVNQASHDGTQRTASVKEKKERGLAAAPCQQVADVLTLDPFSPEEDDARKPMSPSHIGHAAADTASATVAAAADNGEEELPPRPPARGLRSSLKKGPSMNVKRVTIQM